MELHDFMNFEPLVAACPRPRYLRVTHAVAIKVELHYPNDISVKTEHDIDDWDVYESIPLRNLSQLIFYPKYQETLPVPPDLKADLIVAYECIPQASRNYWQFLFD
jgi:hypothetical protein